MCLCVLVLAACYNCTKCVANNCNWTKCVLVAHNCNCTMQTCVFIGLATSPGTVDESPESFPFSLFSLFSSFYILFSLSSSLSFSFFILLILHSSLSLSLILLKCLLFLVVSFFPLFAMISSPEFAFTVHNKEAWPGSMQVYL